MNPVPIAGRSRVPFAVRSPLRSYHSYASSLVTSAQVLRSSIPRVRKRFYTRAITIHLRLTIPPLPPSPPGAYRTPQNCAPRPHPLAISSEKREATNRWSQQESKILLQPPVGYLERARGDFWHKPRLTALSRTPESTATKTLVVISASA